MTYNHTKWRTAHTDVADSLLSVHDFLEATLPHLGTVQAGHTQVTNHRTLMAATADEADFGYGLITRWGDRFASLNEAITGTSGDRTEKKGYAQLD